MADDIKHDPWVQEQPLAKFDAKGERIPITSPDADATIVGRVSGSVPGGPNNLVNTNDGVKITLKESPGDPQGVYARVTSSENPQTVPNDRTGEPMKGNVQCYTAGEFPPIDPHIMRHAQLPDIKLPAANVATPDAITQSLTPHIGKIIDTCRSRSS